jgi:general secretion pathway protein A
MGHWGLQRDPFAELGSPYVPLPSHEEAVARLVHTIESGERSARLIAAAGLGKTTVLRKAFAESQSPRRRFASVSFPPNASLLFALIAKRLRAQVGRESGRLDSWRGLERALEVSSLEGFHVVLAIDDCNRPTRDSAQHTLDSLRQLGSRSWIDLTVIHLERSDHRHRRDSTDAGGLAISLQPLTRSEAERYLITKLDAAGCAEPIFTPKAITRLQGLSQGIPRVLERLAVLSLISAAARGLEVILPDLVDRAALEYRELAPRMSAWA